MDNKLRIKTVSVVVGTETLVEMPHSHAYIRNIGEEKVYASTSPNITPYDDGVIEIKPNRSKVLANIFNVKKGVGEIYLLSVGDTVCEIESTNVLNFSETVEGGDGSSGSSGSGENGKDGRGILKITFLSSTGGDVAGIEGAVDTYQITYTDGTKSTYGVANGSKGIDGEKGVSIVSVTINDDKHLIVEFSDGNTQDIGKLPQSDVDLTNYYTINETNDKINTEIQNSLENYVQKDGSKVLSTNDYTTVEKTKLAGLTNYDDTEIKNNITAIRTTVDKKVDKVDGYSLVLDSEIEKLSAITNPIKVKGRVDTIDVLPNDAAVGDLYFVGTEDSEDYKEYVLTESREWEQIGVSKVDLSAYVLKEDGKSLVSDTEITRLASVENYDDTQIKNDIALNTSSIGLSRKNLLKPVSSMKRAGITYTVNADGSVSLTGANESTSYNYFSIPITFKAGKYKVSGMPEGSSNSTYRVDIRANAEGGTPYGYGFSEFEVEFTENTTAYYMIYIYASYKEKLDGVKFYPMVRYTDIMDSTYEPYKPDLQTQVSINQSSVGMSKKNLLNNTATTKVTPEGVTFTVNGVDKSVTITGSCTSATGVFLGVIYLDANTKYIISSNTSQALSFQLYEADMATYIRSVRFGSSAELSVDISKKYAIKLCASVNTTYDNVTVYPMIRYADITDSTYEPYTPSLQEQINDILARLTALEG